MFFLVLAIVLVLYSLVFFWFPFALVLLNCSQHLDLATPDAFVLSATLISRDRCAENTNPNVMTRECLSVYQLKNLDTQYSTSE